MVSSSDNVCIIIFIKYGRVWYFLFHSINAIFHSNFHAQEIRKNNAGFYEHEHVTSL